MKYECATTVIDKLRDVVQDPVKGTISTPRDVHHEREIRPSVVYLLVHGGRPSGRAAENIVVLSLM